MGSCIKALTLLSFQWEAPQCVIQQSFSECRHFKAKATLSPPINKRKKNGRRKCFPYLNTHSCITHHRMHEHKTQFLVCLPFAFVLILFFSFSRSVSLLYIGNCYSLSFCYSLSIAYFPFFCACSLRGLLSLIPFFVSYLSHTHTHTRFRPLRHRFVICAQENTSPF